MTSARYGIATIAFVILTVRSPNSVFAPQVLPTVAKTSAPEDLPPKCAASDLDATYQFMNHPPTEQVAITFRNVSQRPCTLQGGVGVVFGDYRHGHSIWTKDCRNCGPDGKSKPVAPITVAPGTTAQLLVTWETEPANAAASCLEGGEMNGNNWDIWAVKLLGDVCSVVRVDSYLPGSSEQELPNDDMSKKGSVTVNLTPSGDTVYWDDSFWLDMTVEDGDGILSLDDRSCPALFVRTRSSNGHTSLQQEAGQCRVTSLGQGPGRAIKVEMPTEGWGMLSGPGVLTVEVFALVGSPHASRVRMVSSNALKLRAVDLSTMPRTWGPESKGLAISLFLDKEKYALGEDIPLRMAVENFSADASIASGELPCFAGLSFEVRDSQGQKKTSDFSTVVCTGHGWVIHYPRGKVVPVRGVTLKAVGLLPNRPGKYMVESIWNAQSEKQNQSDKVPQSFFGAALTPYSVVRSAAARFEIASQQQ